MQFELNDKERLLLANQYEILGILKKENEYLLWAETLRAGHQWIYKNFFETISENLPDAEAQHVITILGLYSNLKDSYLKHSDKTDIDVSQLNFPGFDGNNEGELLSFADSLIKHGRFNSTLGEAAKNSHFPTTEMYNRMISCWIDLGKPNYPFSKEQIQKILTARYSQ